MPDSNEVRPGVEAEARRLFPDAVRRAGRLGYGDSPLIEPGEILPKFVLAGCGAPGETRRSSARASGCASVPLAPAVPRTFDMNAAFMLLELHERGIHVVSAGTRGYSLPRFLEDRMIWVTR
jgi:hypothetical protein